MHHAMMAVHRSRLYMHGHAWPRCRSSVQHFTYATRARCCVLLERRGARRGVRLANNPIHPRICMQRRWYVPHTGDRPGQADLISSADQPESFSWSQGAVCMYWAGQTEIV